MSNLPKYTFLPWLKQGIANEITEVDDKGVSTTGNQGRALMQVNLDITANGASTQVRRVSKDVQLLGPGDILGMNADAVIRTEPYNGISNFEPNYLASIDFYDEDFAWRYTPAKANDVTNQLRPWLFLFVLKSDEFTLSPGSSTALPSITIAAGKDAAFLPKADEIDTWAHVHVDQDLMPGAIPGSSIKLAKQELTDLINENPNKAHCRIIAPRKLEANVDYTVFLVPSFETGRLAGLGVADTDIAAVPAQAPSWGTNAPHLFVPDQWPVYYNWSFSTGASGDFEGDVLKLQQLAIDDPRIGRQTIDLQDPGLGMSYQVELANVAPLTGNYTKTTLLLDGALKIPGVEGEAYPFSDWEDDVNGSSLDNYRTSLQDLVNLGDDLKASTFSSTAGNSYGKQIIGGEKVDDDPIISPPLYGRWHALKSRVNAEDSSAAGEPGWIHELNCDPRHRALAGLGAKIVRDKQDDYLREAWAQVDGIDDANMLIQRTQLSIAATSAMHAKHLQSQPDEKVWTMIGSLSSRMKNGSKTYYQEAKESTLPLATQRGALRKMMRPRGPLMRRIDPTQQINSGTSNLINALDQQTVTAAQPKAAPTMAKTKPLGDVQQAFDQAIDQEPYPFNTVPVGSVAASTAPDESQAVSLRSALDSLKSSINSVVVTPAARPQFGLSKAEDMKAQINPAATISNKVNRKIRTVNKSGSTTGAGYTAGGNAMGKIKRHPEFREAMYRYVREYSTDFIISNLDLIPENSISLLETNQKFIESFMTGLNHEMGRELLWNEYPTDQRGTYFKQFWDKPGSVSGTTMNDIDDIHTWPANTELGEHGTSSSGSDNLVLVFRGDFLKKYPNTLIYAVKADWVRDGNGVPQYGDDRIEDPTDIRRPIFMAKVEPDLTFIGLDITLDEAKGTDPGNITPGMSPEADPGYFFVLKEVAGDIRFGMDIPPDPPETFSSWDDLHWGRLTSNDCIRIADLPTNPLGRPLNDTISGHQVEWDAQMNASDMAMILYQQPVKVLIHARIMLQNAQDI